MASFFGPEGRFGYEFLSEGGRFGYERRMGKPIV